MTLPALAQNAPLPAPDDNINAPVASQERRVIINRIFVSPRIQERIQRNERFRVNALTIAPVDKDEETQPRTRRLAQAVLLNYTTGNASRLLVDANSGEVLDEEALPGRPQPDRDEIQEAINIIKANPELASKLQAGTILEGGFAVDAPPGNPPNNRYIQIQVLSRDRKTLQQFVYVDLTTNKIALSVPNNQ